MKIINFIKWQWPRLTFFGKCFFGLPIYTILLMSPVVFIYSSNVSAGIFLVGVIAFNFSLFGWLISYSLYEEYNEQLDRTLNILKGR